MPMTPAEINRLVAEKVFNLVIVHPAWPCGYMPDGCKLEAQMPAYTDNACTQLCEPLQPSSGLGGFYTELHPIIERLNILEPVPFYSTEIDAAWGVVEKLAKEGWSMHLEWKGCDRTYANSAEVSFTRKLTEMSHAVADTAPMAICKAALAACGVKCE